MFATGSRVKIVKITGEDKGLQRQYLNKAGTITNVDSSEEYPYSVSIDSGKTNSFKEEELELLKIDLNEYLCEE